MALVTLQGKPVHTVGMLPALDSKAPDFTLTKTDLSPIHLKECLGKKTVLNIFPSIDTPICAKSVRAFNETLNTHPNIRVLCISADLPFALKRFCGAEKLDNIIPASTFRNHDFGEKYGVTITDGPLAGLMSRAIVVLNEQGQVIYTQQVPEISHEPDYQAVLKIL